MSEKPTVPYSELPESARETLDRIVDMCLDYSKMPAHYTREQVHASVIHQLEIGAVHLLVDSDGGFSLHATDDLIHHDNGRYSLKQ